MAITSVLWRSDHPQETPYRHSCRYSRRSHLHGKTNIPCSSATLVTSAPQSDYYYTIPSLPAKILPASNLTFNLEGHTLEAVPVGHSDTDDSTFLWVPDLELAVAGDVVYNGAYKYMPETLTASLRQDWVNAVRKIKSFNPGSVVTGHKLPRALDGAWNLDLTIEL